MHRRISFLVCFAAILFALDESFAQQPSFEVASIKPTGSVGPNRAGEPRAGFGCRGIDGVVPRVNAAPTSKGQCSGIRVTLWQLVFSAYFDISPKTVRSFDYISGAPEWANSEGFTIDAKAENADTVTKEDLKQMLQSLLTDRFKLRMHRESKNVPGYALVPARSGAKLKQTLDNDWGPFMNSDTRSRRLTIKGKSTIQRFVDDALTKYLGLPVIDKTQLAGRFDYALTIDTAPSPTSQSQIKGQVDDFDPAIFNALQEQFGLRLESQKVPVQIIVIDSVKRPTEN